MKTYLLTAAGVIFLSIIISFILPDGKLRKVCKFVLRLVCICVLLQPIGSVFNFSQTADKQIGNYEYIAKIYSATQSRELTGLLNKEFGEGYVCFVEIKFNGSDIAENGVTVEGKFENEKDIETITEYLKGLGYINITVNETNR